MNGDAPQNVVLAVTGGIAAYKTPDIVRRLRARGCDVNVVMSRAATAFIGPLTLQAVSGNPVAVGVLDEHAHTGMGHIELGRWADRVLVAPATADFLARLAHGFADDLPATLCLATAAPLFAAPAMNRQMWAAPATRANCRLLRERGVTLLGPGEGEQACGEVGAGRMLEPEDLVELLLCGVPRGEFGGLRLLVSAGPTREAIDPVRYVSNHSSGAMGYSIARAAAAAGAEVVLVAGPCALRAPPGVRFIPVVSARQMREAVLEHARASDIYIGAAAVADYRPATDAPEKLKRKDRAMTLELVANPDIIAEVAAGPERPFTVGFAAETERMAEHAHEKLVRKGLDMVAANRVGVAGRGFDAPDNALSVFWNGGEREFGLMSKPRLATALLELVIERYHAAR